MDPTDLAKQAAESHPGWIAAAVASIAALARELSHRRRKQPDLSGRVLRLESRMDQAELEQRYFKERAEDDREERRQQHADLVDRIDRLYNILAAPRHKGE